MKKLKLGLLVILVGMIALGSYVLSENIVDFDDMTKESISYTEHEAGFDDMPEHVMSEMDYPFGSGGWYTLSELREYQPPQRERPLVGLQIGHWQHREAPDELSGLRGNTGAVSGEYTELAIMLALGEEVAARLRAAGVDVDVLPVTVPPKYEADAFITLHADGNSDPSVRGFKIAGPRLDYTGHAESLVNSLRASYADVTGLPEDPQLTRRMTAYYAFNWARYQHAVHPFTPVAIVETGFVTNPTDRNFLLTETEQAATGITEGVLSFLASERPFTPPLDRLESPALPLQGTVTCAPLRAERVGTRDPGCEASLRTEAGMYYLLRNEEPIATSSLPYEAKVEGKYYPAQTLTNYFWFPYEIRGIVDQALVTPLRE